MITLTGFGGVGEIGGNAFLLEAPGLRVMLDVGKRFGAAETMQQAEGRKQFDAKAFQRRAGWADYFSAFLQPRSASVVSDLGTLDLVPDPSRLGRMYRTDLGGLPGEAPVDAVLVSHAHVDHCGLVPLLRPDLPVVTSAQSLATMHSIETTGKAGWEGDYVEVQARGGYQRGAKGGWAGTRYGDEEPLVRRAFATQARIAPSRSDWEVQAFDVDHSVQGASAFILTDGDTRIVYTGDFRRHGWHPERTAAFLKQADGADVLIMEGTRVHAGGGRHASGASHADDHGSGGAGSNGPGGHGHGGHEHLTDKESDVEAELARRIEQHEAAGGHPFVGVGFPPRDLDRLRSLHEVARRFGRRLLVTTKQAHLIDALRRLGREDLPDWRTDPNLGVFLRASPELLREPGRIPVADKARIAIEYLDVGVDEWARLVSRELAKWELRVLGGADEVAKGVRTITAAVPLGDGRIVTPRDVAREPSAYILGLSLHNMVDLFDIFPDRAKAGGLYVHSMTQPHNDDMEMDQFRLKRWLTAFGLNAHAGHDPLRTHVSGHLSDEDVQEILAELRPKVLVPIHSERPDLTSERYTARTGQKAVLPQWGQPIAIVN